MSASFLPVQSSLKTNARYRLSYSVLSLGREQKLADLLRQKPMLPDVYPILPFHSCEPVVRSGVFDAPAFFASITGPSRHSLAAVLFFFLERTDRQPALFLCFRPMGRAEVPISGTTDIALS